MGLTTIRCDWVPAPAQSRRYGPQEFAQNLLDELHGNQQSDSGVSLKSSYSDEGVRQIVELAYYASQMEEEGRTLRFGIVFGVNEGKTPPLPLVARFRYPVPISDVADLVRIGPAFARQTCALWIAERGDSSGECRLECLGLLNADLESQRIMVGYPDSHMRGRRTALDQQTYLSLWVAGSGHLRASFGLLWEYTLRAGRVRPTLSYAMAPPLAPIFADIERIIRRRFAGRYPDLALPDYVLQNSSEITHLWTRLLDLTVAAQHGGTFLVLPEESARIASIVNRYQIGDGLLVDLDLGSLLVEFSAACARLALHNQPAGAADGGAPSGGDVDRLGELQNEWFAHRTALNIAVETAAGLADVDGCVVLDRSLRVSLFGGKIRTARHDGVLKLLELRDWYDRSQSLVSSMAKLGTRNQSACLFCREHPQSVAFVVSQDGDLRVYTSDASFAYAFESLAPC